MDKKQLKKELQLIRSTINSTTGLEDEDEALLQYAYEAVDNLIKSLADQPAHCNCKAQQHEQVTDKKTEALKKALDALDCIYSPLHVREINKVGAAMFAIREALAEQPANQLDDINVVDIPAQQQEPVAWHHPECEGACIACLIEQEVLKTYGNQGLNYLRRHVLSTPASKPWVGLTDEDKAELDEKYGDDTLAHLDAIEAKLKEKNT